MAKTYQTVKTMNRVNRAVERRALAEIDANNGNPFMPTAADRAAMGRPVVDTSDDGDAELREIARELGCA